MSKIKTGNLKIETFNPIGDKILVLPQEKSGEMTTAAGIIVQETYDTVKRPVKGKVVGVGEKLSDIIKVGDIVVYQKMYELTIEVNNVDHVLLKGENIILVGRE